MYELIVAMDTDGNIGVTDAMGRQRMPWESEATHKSGEVATSKSGEVATHKSGEVATLKSGEVATSKSGATHKSKAIKEDMRYFREKTMNNILIMGRKTFESLPKRPLPGRIHVVLTNTPAKYETEYDENNNSVFFTQLEHLDNVIGTLHELYPDKRVFVCGGEEIYRILLPKCERLHIGTIPERGHNEVSAQQSVGIGRFSGETTSVPASREQAEFRSENTYLMDTYSSILCENETYTKFPKEEEWLSFYKKIDSNASEFDDDSSLVRRTYVKNDYFAT